jgi:hypothetical protein
MLVPYANELFGVTGILGDPSLNPAHGLFPNPSNASLPGGVVTGIIAFLSMMSLLLTFDVMRPVVALVLWFGWTALFHRNNLIANPSIPYVGLLLVLCALVPTGKSWTMPKWIPRCAWILMAAGYTFSGITKMGSASWLDGSAIARLLDNPLARPGPCRDLMMLMPAILPKFLTWGTLVAEITFAPLALSPKLRPWVWWGMVLLHLGIITLLDFADLSLGMLMIHLFIHDPLPSLKALATSGWRWFLRLQPLRERSTRRATQPLPARVSARVRFPCDRTNDVSMSKTDRISSRAHIPGYPGHDRVL